jgi:hypothetical protein
MGKRMAPASLSCRVSSILRLQVAARNAPAPCTASVKARSGGKGRAMLGTLCGLLSSARCLPATGRSQWRTACAQGRTANCGSDTRRTDTGDNSEISAADCKKGLRLGSWRGAHRRAAADGEHPRATQALAGVCDIRGRSNPLPGDHDGIAKRLLGDSYTHIALWPQESEDSPQVIDYKCITRPAAVEWRTGYAEKSGVHLQQLSKLPT